MDAAKKTILLVDDDAKNRRLIEAVLSGDDRSIITANDGQQALAKVAEKQPDMILLDLMMPVMNGLDVLRKLKSDAATASIPVIMITGFDDGATRTRVLEAGASEVICKPMNRLELLTRVNNVLQLHEGSTPRKGNGVSPCYEI